MKEAVNFKTRTHKSVTATISIKIFCSASGIHVKTTTTKNCRYNSYEYHFYKFKMRVSMRRGTVSIVQDFFCSHWSVRLNSMKCGKFHKKKCIFTSSKFRYYGKGGGRRS